MINVYRFLKDYSPGRPQFIEDKLFRTVIPVGSSTSTVDKAPGGLGGTADDLVTASPDTNDDMINGYINGKINDKIKGQIGTQVQLRLIKIMKSMYEAMHVTLEDLVNTFQISIQTARRDMKLLRDADLAMLIGSRKSGRYQLTRKGASAFK